MDIKNAIVTELNNINLSVNIDNIKNLFVLSADSKNGDVSLPCFALAKELKQNPMVISNNLVSEINSKLTNTSLIEKAEAVNGYVNIFTKQTVVAKNVVTEILSNPNGFGKTNLGNGKTYVLDYSSVNLAKYMHIGHLKTTIIGLVISNLLKTLGYKTVSINYVGDYGTPFGKMITAYYRWGSEEEIKARGVDAVQDLYVKFNREVENDATLEVEAREWFKKIENGDKEATRLANWFIELSRGEVERLCNLLGAKFDSWRGERYYSDKMQPVIAELKSKNLLKQSEGAQIVDLEQYGLGAALIQKSDGTSLYLTRDLAAVQDRFEMYGFNNAIYVTDVAQKLHFKQLFKIVELLNKPYAGDLEHVAYGRYSLPTGKISSRLGKQALLADIYNAALNKAKEIMNERGTKVENFEDVANKVAVGAISFEALKYERVKDTVFDLNASLNFDGETSPYMQYTYARLNSVLEKAGEFDYGAVDFSDINLEEGFEIIKQLNKYPFVVLEAFNKLEPCLIVRHLMNLCSEVNRFYNQKRIIENGKVNVNRLAVINATLCVLKNGFEIINIPVIDKM